MNLPPIVPQRTGSVVQDELNRRICERLQELQVLESATIQFQHTSNGMSAEVKPSAGGSASRQKAYWRP